MKGMKAMFIVLLRFSENKAKASQFMEGHNEWLKRGFDDGVFLVAGSIKPGLGGAVLAHGATAEELATRVQQDPFVVEGVVTAEFLDIAPSKTDSRLDFLLA